VYGDVPGEFLDPITATLMEDPVVMPTSGTSIDRATILRHLMSDPRDPISRKPLSAAQLQDNTELHATIAAWKRERRTRAQKPP
jgi:ubiquitin conjugation factor E4 B